MPPTPPTDAELDVMIRARLASPGIDLDQLPAPTATDADTADALSQQHAPMLYPSISTEWG